MSIEAHASKGDRRLSEAWIKQGSTAGIISVLAYMGAATGLIGGQAGLSLAFAFGPLLSIGFVGFYYFIKSDRNSPILQISTLFGVIAGSIVNMMLVVQQALFEGVSKADRAAMGAAWSGLNWIQLGLDVSWDIYIGVATVLLGLTMWSHPRFGKIFAIISVGLGVALLVLNMSTFPVPPGDAGSVDIGPFVGLWFLVLAIRVRTSVRWWRRTYLPAEQA